MRCSRSFVLLIGWLGILCMASWAAPAPDAIPGVTPKRVVTPAFLSVAAGVLRVATVEELYEAVQDVKAGEVILLADGVYEGDRVLRIVNKHGSPDRPIVIAAENIGEAILAGRMMIEVRNSSHLVIEGLKLVTSGESAARPAGIVLQETSSVRVTRNDFALTETYGSQTVKDWVHIYAGTSNRIDHNHFENKLQRGTYIALSPKDSDMNVISRGTRIDHNYFGPMAPLGVNGMEAVRLDAGGYQLNPQLDAGSILEYNLFDRADGEKSEIVSIKSNGNIIRYNTFLESTGRVIFRQGSRNSVYGNYFIGNGKAGTGGVVVYGEDQRVYNNYFAGLDKAAVTLGLGNVDDAREMAGVPGGYLRLRRAEIVFNTMVDNRETIVLENRNGFPFFPESVTLADNLIVAGAGAPVLDGRLIFAQPEISWEGNLILTGAPGTGAPLIPVQMRDVSPEAIRIIDEGLSRNPDAVYYPSGKGAAVDAGTRHYSHVRTDIEGKPRDERPDVGAFEFAGRPLLRGPLQPHEVGPFAPENAGAWDAPGIFFTALEISEGASDELPRGPLTLSVDGVATGGAQEPVVLQGWVGDIELFRGERFPARIDIDMWRLDEGANRLTLIAQSGAVRAERILTIEAQNIVIHSPAPEETISGVWPVSLEIHIPEQVVESVQVSLDGQAIYTGKTPPTGWTVNTRLLEDGVHTLEVRVARRGLQPSTRSVRFRVRNYWELNDELLPPVTLFGMAELDRSRTRTASDGWRHVTDHPQDFFGDADRLEPSWQSEREYLEWDAPGLTRAAVTVFARRPEEVEEALGILVSPDCTEFHPVQYDVRVTGSPSSDWHRVDVTAEGLGEEYIACLRLVVSGGERARSLIQIGHVALYGLNEQN